MASDILLCLFLPGKWCNLTIFSNGLKSPPSFWSGYLHLVTAFLWEKEWSWKALPPPNSFLWAKRMLIEEDARPSNCKSLLASANWACLTMVLVLELLFSSNSEEHDSQNKHCGQRTSSEMQDSHPGTPPLQIQYSRGRQDSHVTWLGASKQPPHHSGPSRRKSCWFAANSIGNFFEVLF